MMGLPGRKKNLMISLVVSIQCTSVTDAHGRLGPVARYSPRRAVETGNRCRSALVGLTTRHKYSHNLQQSVKLTPFVSVMKQVRYNRASCCNVMGYVVSASVNENCRWWFSGRTSRKTAVRWVFSLKALIVSWKYVVMFSQDCKR